MATTGSSPAEGWYPDPSGVGRRWWDGTAWTEHYQVDDAAAAAPAPTAAPATASAAPVSGGADVVTAARSRASTAVPDPGTIDPVVVAGAGGALILLLSLLAPWVSSPFGAFNAFSGGLPWFLTGGDFEVSGGEAVEGSFTSGIPHGWIFLLLAFGALGVAYMHFTGADWTGNALLGIGGFTILLAFINAFVMRGSKLRELTVDVGVSWGVFVAILGGLLIGAAGALVLARSLSPAS